MAAKKTKSAPKRSPRSKRKAVPTAGFLSPAEMVDVIHNHEVLQKTMTPAQRELSRAVKDTLTMSEIVTEVERLKPGQYLIRSGRAYIRTHDLQNEDVTTYVNRLERAAIILNSKLEDANGLARVRFQEIQRLEEAYAAVRREFSAWELFCQAVRRAFGFKRFA